MVQAATKKYRSLAVGNTLQPGKKLLHVISATVDHRDFQASFFDRHQTGACSLLGNLVLPPVSVSL